MVPESGPAAAGVVLDPVDAGTPVLVTKLATSFSLSLMLRRNKLEWWSLLSLICARNEHLCVGATKLSITTFSIATLSIVILCIVILCIMKLSTMTLSTNDTQHK